MASGAFGAFGVWGAAEGFKILEGLGLSGCWREVGRPVKEIGRKQVLNPRYQLAYHAYQELYQAPESLAKDLPICVRASASCDL